MCWSGVPEWRAEHSVAHERPCNADTVRIASLNVFMGSGPASALASMVRKELDGVLPDVLCLQEVPTESEAAEIAALLDMDVALFSFAMAGCSNAVLVTRGSQKVSVVATATLPLRVNPRYRVHGGTRSAGLVALKVPGRETRSVTLACTHLDHMCEVARLAQMDYLVRTLSGLAGSGLIEFDLPLRGRAGTRDGEKPALPSDLPTALAGPDSWMIVGDFNAHRRTDLPEKRLAEVTRRRAAAHLAPPEFQLWDALQKAGCVDAAEIAAVRPAEPLVTSIHGVRVDYVVLSQQLAQRCRVAAVGHATPKRRETDHALVVADVAF
eukprot:TRINITY_DN12342_c0_g1_i1.p1 TRINITY_DN12342_c0_g1~~TRINITY_DN12342_c0_g1_i1.p1  ORF type:complete len:324 (+),score=19.61 TRINITY_DN12342_c0_g1_i1:46-1017(+)